MRVGSLALLTASGLASAQIGLPPSVVNFIGPFSLQVLSHSTVNDTYVAVEMASRFGGNSYYGLFSATPVTYNNFYLNNTASNASTSTELIAAVNLIPYGATLSAPASPGAALQTVEFDYVANQTGPPLFSLNAENHLLYGGESRWLSCNLGYKYGTVYLQLAWDVGPPGEVANCTEITLLCVL